MSATASARRGGAANLNIRVRHERLILDVLRRVREPALSQSELVRETGLSHATIATIVDSLEGSFLNVRRPRGAGPSRSGRPRRIVSIKGGVGVALGIDLGQRHVRVAVSDLAHDRYEDVKVVPPSHGDIPIAVADDPETSLECAVQLAREQLTERQISADRVIGVCVGVPAPVDQRDGGSIASPFAMPGWAGLQVADEVRSRLGWDVPILVENDANLVALAEQEWGAARGARRGLIVKWAYGIGGALLLNGRLDTGLTGIAGELGHVPVPDDMGRPGTCSSCQQHCLQHVAGWKAIAAALDEPDRAAHDLISVARTEGGKRVREEIEQAAEYIGWVLGGVVTLLNLDRIIICGHIDESNYEVVRNPLSRSLRLHTMQSHRRDVTLVPGAVPHEAAARGAVLQVMHRALDGYLDRRLAQIAR